MSMAHYLLHPTSPLVFGTGKPLDFGLGGDSLNFPFPPTLAGALRAAEQTVQERDADPFADPSALCGLGPAVLARVGLASATVELLFEPAADAVYFSAPARHLRPLLPQRNDGDVCTDLDDTTDPHRPGAATLQLLHLGGAAAEDAKPESPPAEWKGWTGAELARWLARPANPPDGQWPLLPGSEATGCDARCHVAINPASKGADAGQLFRTTGRDFSARLLKSSPAPNGDDARAEQALVAAPEEPVAQPAKPQIGQAVDLKAYAAANRPRANAAAPVAAAPALPAVADQAFHHEYAIALSVSGAHALNGVARRVGGEGRFAFIRAAANLPWPAVPQDLPKAGQADASVRVRFILITPALFDDGWAPQQTLTRGSADNPDGWFVCNGVACRIVAAALPRAQAFSGWGAGGADRGNGQGSKKPGPGLPTRVVPAGSVYWLEIQSGNPADLHLQSLCDARHAADGWGYGVVGVA